MYTRETRGLRDENRDVASASLLKNWLDEPRDEHGSSLKLLAELKALADRGVRALYSDARIFPPLFLTLGRHIDHRNKRPLRGSGTHQNLKLPLPLFTRPGSGAHIAAFESIATCVG